MNNYLFLLMLPATALLAYLLEPTTEYLLPQYEIPKVTRFVLPSDVKRVQFNQARPAQIVQAKDEFGSVRLSAFLPESGKATNVQETIVDIEDSDNLDFDPILQVEPLPPSAQMRFRLLAIMIDGNRRTANIDGEIFAVGEQIDEYKILSIGRDHVWLKGLRGREQLKFEEL